MGFLLIVSIFDDKEKENCSNLHQGLRMQIRDVYIQDSNEQREDLVAYVFLFPAKFLFNNG